MTNVTRPARSMIWPALPMKSFGSWTAIMQQMNPKPSLVMKPAENRGFVQNAPELLAISILS